MRRVWGKEENKGQRRRNDNDLKKGGGGRQNSCEALLAQVCVSVSTRGGMCVQDECTCKRV